MANRRNDDRAGLGVALIIIGGFWLLFRMNILSFSIFSSLGVLWPLIFVVAGLNILFRKIPYISVVTWGLFIAVLVMYGQFSTPIQENLGIESEEDTSYARDVDFDWDYNDSSVGWSELPRDEGTVGTPSERLERAQLIMNFGAGNVTVADGGDDMVTFDVPEENTEIREEKGDETARYSFRSKKHFGFDWGNADNFEYDFQLNTNAVWEIDLDTGAVDADLNLRNLNVRDLRVDSGAGDVTLAFGSKAKQVNALIDTGAADITLFVPENVGLRIELDGLINDQNFESTDMVKDGDVWTTPGFENADIQIDIEIDMGVGNVQLITE